MHVCVCVHAAGLVGTRSLSEDLPCSGRVRAAASQQEEPMGIIAAQGLQGHLILQPPTLRAGLVSLALRKTHYFPGLRSGGYWEKGLVSEPPGGSPLPRR